MRLYGPDDPRARGGTVTFNALDAGGGVIPFAVVEARTRAARVSVRGGCFCDPGASEAAFGFPADATRRCLESTARAGWSVERFAACLPGHAVGAVRASAGLATNDDDVMRLAGVVAGLRGG